MPPPRETLDRVRSVVCENESEKRGDVSEVDLDGILLPATQVVIVVSGRDSRKPPRSKDVGFLHFQY